MKDLRITALAGGIGAARFLEGLIRVIDPRNLTVIVNTADDLQCYGLHISPDIDIVMYTLAGVVNPKTGWGFRKDRFFCLKELGKLHGEDWFQLGDRDLATHIYRSWLLRRGWSLTEVTDTLRKRFSLRCRILPMSDDPVCTRMATDQGTFHFQEYLVKRKAKDRVRKVHFHGIQRAQASLPVLQAVDRADGIIICPSNPIVSIGPILRLPGLRPLLRKWRSKILAISPIVGGKPVKGPAAQIMSGLGMEVSARQVAWLYRDIVKVFILDRQDLALVPEIESLGLRVIVTDTIMKDLQAKVRLARVAYEALRY